MPVKWRVVWKKTCTQMYAILVLVCLHSWDRCGVWSKLHNINGHLVSKDLDDCIFTYYHVYTR